MPGRTAGHKLTLSDNGQKKRVDKIWFAKCKCGWEEQRKLRGDVVAVYQEHLKEARVKNEKKQLASLTIEEERLLLNPPTERTWICSTKNHQNTGDVIVSGRQKECPVCRKNRPQEPKLLWPVYVAACEKVGITPGDGRFRQLDAETGLLFPKGGERWKRIPLTKEG